MIEEKKIILLETTLARLIAWIQSADQKAAFALTLSMAMLSALVAISSSTSNWNVKVSVSIIFAIIPLLVSIISVAMAAFPRTKGTFGSLIFFGGITTRSLTQYQNQIITFNNQEYINDLSEQCYINAIIAEKKFFRIKTSLACLFASIIPWALTIYFVNS